ncbi:DUF6090 family protein [Seonamhaeicola aphaedonensis]|uniref:Uncharacterized protein n=1 Tax=Seonamhaeicola aphaedonensis TaxID=1461338 RepID=A0A3D9H410_9FLAO|nr:DUF6090 family protein [Seonamhaeicola aphaedonensis]RED44227.1 hypothetical protein DFQ02_1195 [Seonamhaeicola aphaedonensis]
MIKFFRKIRHNLLSEGKTGKYLKYAIGEIVLVVIGILIALQINNWNEERKANNLEVKLLKDLVLEMKQNKSLLENAKSRHKAHDSISTVILEQRTNLTAENYLQHLVFTTYFATTDFVNGNVQSILSEHGPSIISNDTLKEFVTTWKEMAHDITENELIEQQLIFEQVLPVIYKNIDLSKIDPLIRGKESSYKNYLADVNFQNDIKDLISSNEFNGVVYSKAFNDRVIVNYDLEPILEKINNAIKIAEKQLEQ